jgi:hypothetical protein
MVFSGSKQSLMASCKNPVFDSKNKKNTATMPILSGFCSGAFYKRTQKRTCAFRALKSIARLSKNKIE